MVTADSNICAACCPTCTCIHRSHVTPLSRVNVRLCAADRTILQQVWVNALSSTSDTLVAKKRVAERISLKDGDLIEIGQRQFIFHSLFEKKGAPGSAEVSCLTSRATHTHTHHPGRPWARRKRVSHLLTALCCARERRRKRQSQRRQRPRSKSPTPLFSRYLVSACAILPLAASASSSLLPCYALSSHHAR